VTRIWVDADGCPMKNEIYKVAKRSGVPVTLVANHDSSCPGWVRMEVVDEPGVPDAADRHILRHARPGDVVVTDDLPLARRCLAYGLLPVSNRGTRFREGEEGDLDELRDEEVEVRETGGARGGPLPLGRKDRSAFRAALRDVLEEVG